MSKIPWIVLLTLSFIQFACTSKPISRQSEADQKSLAKGQARSSNPATSGASGSASQPTSATSDTNRADASGDLDQIARAAEKEGTKKFGKPAEPVVLPVGTKLYIHLQNEVGSKLSKSGDEFGGTLAAPIAVEDHVVIPAGANVGGRVVQAKPAGRFKGGAVLALELRSIVVNGKKVLMHTQMMTTETKGKGKRTAGLVAGGGAGGAAIGAVAGGGKGAAIGTAVGVSTGATVAALTGKRDITLPVEAVIAFRLNDAIELKRSVPEKADP